MKNANLTPRLIDTQVQGARALRLSEQSSSAHVFLDGV